MVGSNLISETITIHLFCLKHPSGSLKIFSSISKMRSLMNRYIMSLKVDSKCKFYLLIIKGPKYRKRQEQVRNIYQCLNLCHKFLTKPIFCVIECLWQFFNTSSFTFFNKRTLVKDNGFSRNHVDRKLLSMLIILLRAKMIEFILSLLTHMHLAVSTIMFFSGIVNL